MRPSPPVARCQLRLPGILRSLLLVACALWGTLTQSPAGTERPVHPTRILAKYRDTADAAAMQQQVQPLRCSVLQRFPMFPGLAVLEAEPDRAQLAAAPGAPDPRKLLEQRLESLRRSGLFEWVEPDPLVRASTEATDAAFADGRLWGLNNTGIDGGMAGADIAATRAWAITTGSTNVIVAVIDTGIRHTHVDLASQMWRNPGEIPGNRLDDDHNGYVDDVFGINAITGSGDPLDDEGHGTHVAGTIGAAANDGNPHVGVAWNVRLLAAKFLDARGEGYTSDAIRCIDYAVAQGARIINASWGGDTYSQALFETLSTGATRRVLFVAAAGNDGSDNDLHPSYPASFDLENLISVAAIDRADKRADFSNFGRHSVHLAAPGAQIFSTSGLSDRGYTFLDGTSMATPHVSGAAALLLARYPDASVIELRQRLLTTVEPTPDLARTTASGGRLNAFNALQASADGVLELAPSPAPGSPVVAGRNLALRVRVSDLARVTGSTVVALTGDGANLPLRDDGNAPDVEAGDATFSAWMPAPSADPALALTLIVQAPGKTTAVLPLDYPLVSPPANDDFANRQVLTGSTQSVEASNQGATAEPGEPTPTTLNPGGASVWWSWQAPDDGILTLDTDGSDFDTLLAIYTGDSLSELTRIAGNDDSGFGTTSSLTLFVQHGVTYPIVVDGFSGSSGRIRLQLSFTPPPPPPANDDFARAFVLTPTPDVVQASNLSATRETGEPRHAGNKGGSSVWWTWTAPASGPTRLTTDGSEFDTLLAVYRGDSLPQLVLVASDDESGNGSRSLLNFEAAAGTTYRIAVDGYNGAFGVIRLSLSLDADPPAPANDDFESPAPLTGPSASASGSNLGATRQTGEPDHAGNAGGRSIWWTWTAPGDGRATVSTAGSDFDTLLAVYPTASPPANPPVASNDQDPAGKDTSRVAFRVRRGESFLLAVDGKNSGFGAAQGQVTLTLTLDPPPEPATNDDFARRAPLEGWTTGRVAHNGTASGEPGEPLHANKPGGRSLWWTWTAPGNGQAVIDTDGSDFDTVLAVYTGSGLTHLVPVASDDDSGSGLNSRVAFPVTRDSRYEIAVDGHRGASGEIRLHVTAEPDPSPPPNDAFTDRTRILDPQVPFEGTNRGATREPDEPAHLGQPRGHSVWWSWTAPTNALLSITTRDSDFDTVLAVYTGSSLTNLMLVASNNDHDSQTWSQVDLEAQAGRTYQIAVDGAGAATGEVRLQLSLSPVEGPRIDSQPSERTVNAGEIAAFSVRATSAAPATFRWRRNGIPLTGEDGRIFGTTASQLVLLNVGTTDVGSYSVEVRNSAGSTFSQEAALRLKPPLRLGIPPGPQPAGTPFRLEIQGAAGVSYQVESSDDLSHWLPLGSFRSNDEAIPVTVTDPASVGRARRFYRARILP